MPRKSSSTHAIRLSGLKEALAAVAALPEMTRVRVLDATRQAAYRTAQRARPLVPVRYGFLRDALVWKVSRGGIGVVGIARRRHALPGRGGSALVSKGARLATTTQYAHLAHFGTRRSRGVPFMTIAANAERQDFQKDVKAAMSGIGADVAQIGMPNL